MCESAYLTTPYSSWDCVRSNCDFTSAYQILSKSDHNRQSYDVIAIFNVAGVSHVGFALDQPRSVTDGVYFILKFQLDWINIFGDNAIFVLWHFGLILFIDVYV